MRLVLAVSVLAVWLLALSPLTGSASRAADALAYRFTSIEGEPLPLDRYRGRPLLVVNTASFCGYTDQYAELQEIWERYGERGLVVLGVPSDDFNQELDSDAAVKEFCEVEFGVTFPLTTVSHVRGPASHPLFAHFRDVLGDGAGPSWNFNKYLIAPTGEVVAAWPARTRPGGPEITGAIERFLPAS
jgi:glutathione peroxidase